MTTMKKSDLLELFISGQVIYENVTKVTVDDETDMKWLVGAVDGKDVAHGTYLVYYMPIEKSYGETVKPDYTLHDEDGTEIFMLRMDDKLELSADEAQTLKSVLHAVYKTWRRDPGMNIGSSHVFNLYSQDLDAIINIHDRL